MIYPHVNRLIQVCAATGDVLYLYPKLLDAVHNCPHHMDPVRIKKQQGDYVGIPGLLPWDQHFVDPDVHHLLIPSGFGLTSIDSISRVATEL